MSPKLIEHIKKAGFAKLEITVDAGLENESEEDEQPIAPPGAAAPSVDAAAASPGTPPPTPPPGGPRVPVPPAPPPPAPQTPAPGADAGALTARITSLVKQLIPLTASDPARLDIFKKTAAAAQAALKSGDLAGAAKAADALQAMLDIPPAAPAASAGNGARPNDAAPPDPAAAQKVAKSRLAWLATRKKVETDLGKLKSVVIAACQGDIESALEAGSRERAEPVLEQLDESLAHKLDEVNGAADAAQRAKLVAGAKAIVKRYEAFAAGSQIIAKLDANPFFPLAISRTLATTLGTFSSAIR